MKTAISISDPIFEEVNTYAKKEGLSRSEVFVRAIKEFLQRHQNLKILNALNQVYQSPPTQEEKLLQKARKKYQSRKLSDSNSW